MKKIMRRVPVCLATGLARATLYNLIAKGKFPPPVSLGGRSVGWLADEIEQWILDRQTERDAKRNSSISRSHRNG